MKKQWTIIEILQNLRERNYEFGQKLIDNHFFSNDKEDHKQIKLIYEAEASESA